ncbi:hypothetical protein Klosneuvirus_1_203 [Klosneuvirus KNV1]|uniref:Uncharacterized protein n=1 Tax=Klosneuvirus KNV1 TaxID=1977640 RepID=A0A1V0SHZ1_9VIRU|nr:hypothetical protein Klosneuvirus_1_203 [Klosneuvirus KNV1]
MRIYIYTLDIDYYSIFLLNHPNIRSFLDLKNNLK